MPLMPTLSALAVRVKVRVPQRLKMMMLMMMMMVMMIMLMPLSPAVMKMMASNLLNVYVISPMLRSPVKLSEDHIKVGIMT